jgi:hypothetical protein
MPNRYEKQIAQINLRLGAAIDKAKIDAINEVARQLMSESAQILAREMRLDVKTVIGNDSLTGRPGLRLRKATPQYPVATIVASGKRVPLIEFGGEWDRGDAGASYINRRGARKVVPGSFIATLPGRQPQIYKRKYRQQPKNKPHGFPLRTLYGPSVPGVFRSEPVQVQLRRFVRDRLPIEMRRALKTSMGR